MRLSSLFFEKNVFSLAKFAERSGMNPVEVVECFQEAFWKEITPGEYNRLLRLTLLAACVLKGLPRRLVMQSESWAGEGLSRT